MAKWLLKTEPGSWSWEQQVRHNVTAWDGVRNYQAANNMKRMQLNDLCFFYHSVKEKRIVGIVRVIKTSYPDPIDTTGHFVCVDVQLEKELKKPVSLSDIKKMSQFSHLPLIRQSRLSVMEIDDSSWDLLCQMGGLS
ncbi:MAG: EVE domain-containing protein [Candidatus Paracaedimonas acanthamoebae]|mgnify:FL=1|uniref:EVE domain-containing protein n=1 Tax=Candidatus Paracaedimonas acanthamoebae TaxID=244581 RepID=A0A8J7TTZ8_9PROT|nr:EVE domain-containing protein [Candidatus Paracaedimonas acanthamoebae]